MIDPTAWLGNHAAPVGVYIPMVATERSVGLRRRGVRWLLAIALVPAACTSTDDSTTPTTPGDTTVPASVITAPAARPVTSAPDESATAPGATGFDDHTVARIDSIEQFRTLARSAPGGASVVKFSIPEMPTSDDVVWLDSTFYEIHDQWYWFRLLNGARVPGFDVDPVEGLSFDTIDEVVDWADGQDAVALPLDLRFIDSRTYGRRLYSDDFYRVGFTKDVRNYGLGSLIQFPDAADGETHWLMELQFSDVPTAPEVARYFGLLAATLPEEIGDRLEWVLRSPEQEAVASAMVAAEAPFHDRIVRYRDLVPPGRVEVYNAAIAAGRLLIVDGVTTTLADARPTDIVVVENVPDELPPAAALITSAPQTPLAHVNLLARNRGIPNASRSGILDDAGLRQAGRVRARAVVRTTVEGELEIALISREEFDEWQALGRVDEIAVPTIDRASTPTVVDLTALAATIDSEADIEPLRPLIGGKSAGFLTLLSATGTTAPDRPLAITVRPYLEHLDTVRRELDAMLADDEFQRSAPARFLLLEGPDDYANTYTREADERFATEFVAKHPVGTPLGDVIAAGGFKRLFRDVPIDRENLAEITTWLTDTHGAFASTQGLRFRSSSSVEDVEGFTGAGLYDSNTGFLDPAAQPDPDDRDRTVERAVKKTWASYWSFEAYEERELERIDHRSGAMGVLVHARFDDPLELANGVATFTLQPAISADLAVATVNVHAGAVSVTNPDPTTGALPEVIDVRLGDNGAVTIARAARSNRVGDEHVLGDEQVRDLFAQLRSVAELWRERTNRALTPEQAVEVVTLDFEFKLMASGWPARRSGDAEPDRLVVKQVRSLDPGRRGVPEEVLALPIPRDLLARARRVVATECDAADGARSITRIEITTNPALAPALVDSPTLYVIELDEPPVDARCTRDVVLSTPDEFLLQLLALGTHLELIG